MLYRPAEAADAIGVSRARAYELIAAGVIPSIKIGSSIRVPVEALRAWIDRQLESREAAAR
jgi:excisionase family DNA binding protein